MRVLLAAVVAAVVEGRLTLKKQGNKVPINTGKVYDTKEDACCACFKTKYSFPANAGFAATYAAKHTCDTCYVADRYGIDAEEESTFDVPKGHNKTDEGYEQTNAEVKEIQEWNWNCAEGAAPEDTAAWEAGPVPGEPAARDSFLMCKESAGWYCAGTAMKKAGEDVQALDEDTGAETTVETMAIPAIAK